MPASASVSRTVVIFVLAVACACVPGPTAAGGTALAEAGRVAPGSSMDAFVNFDDFAPTLLAVAGIDPPEGTTGRSLLPLLTGGAGWQGRDAVFLERERHANVRRGDRGYPVRAIRTRTHLYVRNLEPELWPVGDPETWFSVGPFGDCDTTPTKRFILDHREAGAVRPFFDLNFAKRPAEELYDLQADPAQKCNVAADPAHAETKRVLAARLAAWMRETGDPRAASSSCSTRPTAEPADGTGPRPLVPHRTLENQPPRARALCRNPGTTTPGP